MSRLVQAAKHYGCPKKRFKFEMKIHRVVLNSEKRKLFTRVLWTRSNKKEKSNKKKFKTKWCEGVENYNIDESIFHEATIYFASNTNQVQSKQTKITLQIRERIDGKDQKFAKFSLDLAKYVDILSPHRIFYQRLNYEKARKKAQLIFTIKSMEILNDGTVSDYTDDDEVDDDDDDDDIDDDTQSNYTEDDNDSVLSIATLNTIQNTIQNSKSKSKRHSAPNALAIHSDISGKQLKNRHYRNQSLISSVTITRRDPRHDPTNISSSISDDISELKRKLKLYEDKHKKYKYKYAKLSKKVEEQEIEARCQHDQICRLKRIEEDVKEQKHTMTKYKKKIKMLTKERESLKKTLQKRNQTIIHLNKENSKLKEQVMSLQTIESVRYNSDDNITEFNDYQNNTSIIDEEELNLSKQNQQIDDKSLTVPLSTNGKDEVLTPATISTMKDVSPQPQSSKNGDNNGPSESILKLVQKQTDDTILNTALYINTLKDTNIRNDSILSDIQQQWMQAETEKLHYKKLYEKEKAKINHYKSKTSSAHKKYEKSEIELSIVRHQFEELQQKHEVMEEVYMKLKQDLTNIMDRYSKLEYEYDKVQEKLRQRDQYLIDEDNHD